MRNAHSKSRAAVESNTCASLPPNRGVEMCIRDRSYVGSTQPRPFRLEGNRLIITATHGLVDEGIQKRVLVWERPK